MKGKTLKLMIRDFNSSFDFVKDKLKSKKKYVQPKDAIYFDSPESLRAFLTPQKLEILSIITNSHPESVYKIAKLVNRNIASVQKDCNSLEDSGFINLEISMIGKKERKSPILSFDYTTMEVILSNASYRIDLEVKAS